MPVEFIGFITNNNSSETIVRTGPVLDPPYIETVANAHELAGFDRALLAFHSTTPDALQVAQHVLGITKKLNMMIAQRPGFTAPRHQPFSHSWFRSPDRRDRIWPRIDPADAETDRRTRGDAGRGGGIRAFVLKRRFRKVPLGEIIFLAL
jgi:hypothetical protein